MSEQNQPVITLLTSLIRERSYSGEEAGIVRILESFFKENSFTSAGCP